LKGLISIVGEIVLSHDLFSNRFTASPGASQRHKTLSALNPLSHLKVQVEGETETGIRPNIASADTREAQ
jgi:hypothetical protein